LDALQKPINNLKPFEFSENMNNEFPVLGPYKYQDSIFIGQYKNGLREGKGL